MKVKLTLEDRLLLHTLYPQKSSYKKWVAFKESRKVLNFTEEETRKFDISTQVAGDQQHVQFNTEASAGYLVECDIPRIAMDHFISTLKQMSENEEMTEMYFNLYEKLVG